MPQFDGGSAAAGEIGGRNNEGLAECRGGA
jgi:hypothetical protein